MKKIICISCLLLNSFSGNSQKDNPDTSRTLDEEYSLGNDIIEAANRFINAANLRNY